MHDPSVINKETKCAHCGTVVCLEHFDKEMIQRRDESLGELAINIAGCDVLVDIGDSQDFFSFDYPDGTYPDGSCRSFDIDVFKCPKCNRALVYQRLSGESDVLLYPRSINRGVDLSHVEPSLVKDYTEAVDVLGLSANSSAALLRRVLQRMLILNGANKRDKLHHQINEMKAGFPSTVALYIDKIRVLGNLAAHASEDAVTADIVDVGVEEAEWMLSLVEELFDHYYIKPKSNELKMAKIEAKLQKIKKQP